MTRFVPKPLWLGSGSTSLTTCSGKPLPPYYTPSRNRPNLPNELWQCIFELASSLEELLDVDLIGAEFPRGAFEPHDRMAIVGDSVMTRMSIVRVCKSWHALGTPILYAHMHFQWITRLKPVLENFASSGKGTHLARYVKRLDLLVHIAEPEPFRNLIHMLPNLQTLTVAVQHTPHVRTYGTILGAFAGGQGPSNSLKALIWYTDFSWQFVPAPLLADLLQALPNLQVLRWQNDQTMHSSWREDGANKPPPPIRVNLDSLRVLRLPGDALLDPWLLAQCYPSLARLTCIPTGQIPFYNPQGNDGWRKFIQRHGPQLRHLELQLLTNSISTMRVLELVRHNCPNLVRLDVLIDQWSDLPTNMMLLPSIKTFGLSKRSPSFGLDKEGHQHLVRVVENLDAAGLDVIQFNVKQDLWDFEARNPCEWREMKTVLLRRGLKIHNFLGHIFEG